MRNFLMLVWIGFVIPLAKGQNVQVTINAPKVVETGQQFQYEINVNATPSDFQGPDMSSLRVLFGPSTSQSSSVQIINGHMTQSSSYSYTYVLQAPKAGKYTIGAATVTVNGKKYQSDSFTFQAVGNASKNSQSTAGQYGNSGSTGSNQGVKSSDNGDSFFRVLVNKRSLVQGDYLIATVKLYSKLNIASVNPFDFSPDGFFIQEIPIPQPRVELEVVNGQRYNTVVLKKYILIPQRSGNLRIGSILEDCVVQRRIQGRSNSFFDDFFGPSVQNVELKLKSLPITIKVRPLPGNQPANFTGGVGRFTFDASLNKTSVKANDGITLKVDISGTGNLKLIDAPKITFPPNFDTYDPQITQNLNATDGGISGTKTFDYLIIPRSQGDYKIPSLTFTYFDIASSRYKTLTSKEFTIHVAKGSGNQSANLVTGFSKEDVKVLGKDILFIKTDGLYKAPGSHNFFGSIIFWLIYLTGILAFGLIIWLRRRIIKQNANIAFVRNKRADKFATRRLKQANIHLKSNEQEQFYEELINGLWGYLSDKMNIPLSDLSRDNARVLLIQHGVGDEPTQMFIDLIDNCEFARYAPPSAGISMKEDYDKAVSLITKLQQKLR